MNIAPSQDESLAKDIEELRERFTRTPDLYREVCALLFFRYGITPTANKLYQLVRKGSMSAPADALAQFWSVLREKSRTRIEHPDLPEEIRELGGDLLGQLWVAAQGAARQSLEAYRQEAGQSVIEAQTAVQAAQDECDTQRALAVGAQNALASAQEQMTVLREHIAALENSNQTITAALEDEKNENSRLQASLDACRKEFALELDALRTTMQRTEDRSRSIEKRMLVDIDRERVTASKLQKELDMLRLESMNDARRYSESVADLQHRLDEVRRELSEADLDRRLALEHVAAAKADNERLTAALHAAESVKNAQPRNKEKVRRTRSDSTTLLRRRVSGHREPRKTAPRAFEIEKDAE